jgi:DNA-directed RNA polymerase specialized sigma24 family protein
VYIPPGLEESEVISTIQKVSKRLAKQYAFAHFTTEDLQQQCFVWSLENLERFQEGRSLENYLQVVLRNKLNNLRRDKLHRSEIPCKPCHKGNFCTPDGPCARHIEWLTTNKSKADILYPVPIEIIEEENEPGLQLERDEDNLVADEIQERITEQLPNRLRAHYLRMLDGGEVSPSHRNQVRQAIRKILWEKYADEFAG